MKELITSDLLEQAFIPPREYQIDGHSFSVNGISNDGLRMPIISDYPEPAYYFRRNLSPVEIESKNGTLIYPWIQPHCQQLENKWRKVKDENDLVWLQVHILEYQLNPNLLVPENGSYHLVPIETRIVPYKKIGERTGLFIVKENAYLVAYALSHLILGRSFENPRFFVEYLQPHAHMGKVPCTLFAIKGRPTQLSEKQINDIQSLLPNPLSTFPCNSQV